MGEVRYKLINRDNAIEAARILRKTFYYCSEKEKFIF